MLPLTSLAGAAPVLTSCGGDSTGPSGCCKICTTGKPCGDTCIERTKSCDKGPGCACQG
jgi:hypothetical protein